MQNKLLAGPDMLYNLFRVPVDLLHGSFPDKHPVASWQCHCSRGGSCSPESKLIWNHVAGERGTCVPSVDAFGPVRNVRFDRVGWNGYVHVRAMYIPAQYENATVLPRGPAAVVHDTSRWRGAGTLRVYAEEVLVVDTYKQATYVYCIHVGVHLLYYVTTIAVHNLSDNGWGVGRSILLEKKAV